MNVALLTRREIERSFEDATDYRAQQAAQDAKRAMQLLLSLSEDARNRDALIPVLDDLNLVRVAINVVTERVECREAAQ